MIQIALALFGLSALYMAMGRNAQLRRWSPIVGLCGQPFWLYFAVNAGAWGMFALSVAYSLVYIRGAWVQFAIKDDDASV